MPFTPDQKSEIEGIVKNLIAHGIVDKKVCDTPLESYDVVNKRFVYAPGSAPMQNTTVSASNTPTLVPIGTPAFANGITAITNGGFQIVTGGQYLVIGSVYYGNPGAATVRALIYVNGVLVLSNFQTLSGSGIIGSPTAVGILNLNAGDNVQLYGETSSASTVAVTGANSYLSICKI